MSEPRRHRTFAVAPDQFGAGQSLRLGEHEEQGFVGIDTGRVSHGVMMEPAALVAAAGELMAIAGNILERQLRKKLGSP